MNYLMCLCLSFSLLLHMLNACFTSIKMPVHRFLPHRMDIKAAINHFDTKIHCASGKSLFDAMPQPNVIVCYHFDVDGASNHLNIDSYFERMHLMEELRWPTTTQSVTFDVLGWILYSIHIETNYQEMSNYYVTLVTVLLAE